MALLGVAHSFPEASPAFALVYLAVGTGMFFTARLLRPDQKPSHWLALALASTFGTFVFIRMIWPLLAHSFR